MGSLAPHFNRLSYRFFDGKVARAKNTASARGQLFDHSTDFIFVTSGLAGCAFSGLINPYLPVLLHRFQSIRYRFLLSV